MTERAHKSVSRDRTRLNIGPSSVAWDGNALTISVNEICAPLPNRVCGTIRVEPQGLNRQVFTLDANARHRWHPVAPAARISVDLTHPDLRWQGEAYIDSNFGDEPLEDGFIDWTWSRAALRNGSAVLYDAQRKDGSDLSLALRFDKSGNFTQETPPPPAPLPKSLWRVARMTRSDDGVAQALRRFEDAPFYARTLVGARVFGEEVRGVHESLDLGRFSNPVVKLMLPFRMPRRG